MKITLAMFLLSTFIIGQNIDKLDSLTILNNIYGKTHGEHMGVYYVLEESTYVKIELFNILKKSVGVIFNGVRKAGQYNHSRLDFQVPNGVYIIKVKLGENNFNRKAVILNNEFGRYPYGPMIKHEFIDSINTILLDSENSVSQ